MNGMAAISIPQKLKDDAKSFSEALKNSPGIIYMILLCMYVGIFLFGKVNWVTSDYVNKKSIEHFRLNVVGMAFMAGCALYLAYIVILGWRGGRWWQKTLLLIPAAAMGYAGYLFVTGKITKNWFEAIGGVYLCLMAYGKNYKRILQCFFWLAVSALLVAMFGTSFGLTAERTKLGDNWGLSFGIIYPNTWGYIVFLGLIIFWYLYLQKQTIVTFVIFWGLALLMFFVVNCRTISILNILFPPCTLLVVVANKKLGKQKNANVEAQTKKHGFWGYAVVALPLIFFALTIILCSQLELMHKLFKGTHVYSMADRFIEGGIAMRTYGLPLIGDTIYQSDAAYAMLDGKKKVLEILDNSFITYGVTRGMLWMAFTLVWLVWANWKALTRKDYAFLLVSAFLMLYGMMEKPGLDVFYNFALLYPLADAAANTKKYRSRSRWR